MRIFCWFLGYVTLKIQGNELPRFLRLCSSHDLFVWNIQFIEWNVVSLDIAVRDLYRSKSLLKKTRSHILITKRKGWPFIVYRYKRKTPYVCGGMVALLILLYLSGFVWQIEVTGNSYLSNESIERYITSHDAGVGVKKKSIDIDKLETMLLQDFNQIIWDSISIKGSVLSVSIKEQIQIDSATEDTVESKDIKAPVDGKIKSIYVRRGSAAVTIDADVKKNDVLIHGWVPITDESNTVIDKYQPVIADGDIILESDLPVEHRLPMIYNQKIYSGKERRYVSGLYSTLDLNFIPYIYGKMKCTSLKVQRPIEIFRFIETPFYMTEVYEKEYSVKKSTYKRAEMEQKQEQFMRYYEHKLKEKGVQILDKNVMITYKDKECLLKGTIHCILPIEVLQDKE